MSDKMNLGNSASHRELQIIKWATPFKDFTAEEVVISLWEGGKPKEAVFEAYRVACRDLRRREVLKGIATNDGSERFILNDNVSEMFSNL